MATNVSVPYAENVAGHALSRKLVNSADLTLISALARNPLSRRVNVTGLFGNPAGHIFYAYNTKRDRRFLVGDGAPINITPPTPTGRGLLSNDVMVSFNAPSLFTFILQDLLVKTIELLLQILKFCLNVYFIFDGTTYEQVKSTPMGSPISELIDEAVQQQLE
ncbi:hypothetical protein SprV_0100191300 [Sparganum proliferum]